MAERWRSADGHVWLRSPPRYGGCAYASSDPDYVDPVGMAEPPKMEVKVITETVTETIRDGQAFVHRTTTTATCSPAEAEARGMGFIERREAYEWRPQRTRAPRDEENTEPPAHSSAARRGGHGPQHGAPPLDTIDAHGIVRQAPLQPAQDVPNASMATMSMDTRTDGDAQDWPDASMPVHDDDRDICPSSEDRI